MRHPKLLERIEDYKKAFDIVAGEAWDAYDQAHMDILCIVKDDPTVKKRIHDSLADALYQPKRPDVPGDVSGDRP